MESGPVATGLWCEAGAKRPFIIIIIYYYYYGITRSSYSLCYSCLRRPLGGPVRSLSPFSTRFLPVLYTTFRPGDFLLRYCLGHFTRFLLHSTPALFCSFN